MQTETHPGDATDPRDAHPTDTRPTSDSGPRGRTAPIWIAAVIVAVLAVGAALALTGGEEAAPATAGDDVLELSLGDGAALASCLPVDAAILADMSPAFAATATAVEGETVTLAVDRWYAGGDAAQVILHAPAGMEALIAGFDFEVGQPYLITAAGGTVNYCGFSGPATPELQALFDEAFAT
jgi:hypothetical protein